MGAGGTCERKLIVDARRYPRWRCALFVGSLASALYASMLVQGTEPKTAGSDAVTSQAGSEAMRIEFKDSGIRGGTRFPGLAEPVIFDTDQLSQTDADKLERLVRAAHLFDQPRAQSRAMPVPEARNQGQHSITIERGNQRRTVAVPELTDNTNLKELVRFLQRKAGELRRKARTGSAP